MQTNRPFAPSFINKLDRHLLLNKPEAWSARTHMVVYYGLLFIALLTAIAFIVPDDPRERSGASYWVGFVSLVSLIAFIGWTIYLLRFNVFKRYGLTSAGNRLITFLLYFAAIGVFVLFCYVEPAVETVRANAAYTDEEIIKDVNATNLAVAKLEYDSLRHTWSEDTVTVTDAAGVSDDPIMDYTEYYEPEHVPRRYFISHKGLQQQIRTRDSMVKINDSVYVFSTCPEYTMLRIYGGYLFDDSSVLSSLDIYRQVIVNYKPPTNQQELRKQIQSIRDKYEWQERAVPDYDYRQDRLEKIRLKYGLFHIGNSMMHILERKHRWRADNLEWQVRTFIYTTLILTLMVFAFRHSTARTFFLSVLTGVVLLILTSLIIVFANSREVGILNFIFFYFLAALAISITAFTIKKRRLATGIAINILLWMLPFIPLCTVAYYYANLRENELYNYIDDSARQQQALFAAELIGLVLLLLMVPLYFHRAYRKWYAAPEH